MHQPQNVEDILEILMSQNGEAFLDDQISQIRNEMGEEEFHLFAHEYFKKEGEENIYANTPPTVHPN